MLTGRSLGVLPISLLRGNGRCDTHVQEWSAVFIPRALSDLDVRARQHFIA